MKIKILAISLALIGTTLAAPAQTVNDSTQLIDPGVMYVEPLFEYPIAPEELSDFREKCGWLADNFWNPLDIKKKETVDQAKLNHAFQVYATAVQYAEKDRVTAAVDKFMKNLQKNPMLLFQMTKAAEETIYGPRADFWIDELYSRILRAALANKKFPASKRARYELQLRQLDATMVGGTPARFDFVRPNGDPAQYFPMATPTIIVFGDPDCDQCRIGKLRMQSNIAFSKAVADGKINVLFIIPDPEEGWQSEVAGFPSNWSVGASDTVADIYDLREIPEVYVIGPEGTVVNKHIGIENAMETALSLIGAAKK
ncbi:MAG: DUF5106 domain-containing protein [Muribaculaceae bacterium]|nr:DUF5106 domain-containing protein [Muribaculaceae bacterium]